MQFNMLRKCVLLIEKKVKFKFLHQLTFIHQQSQTSLVFSVKGNQCVVVNVSKSYFILEMT